MNILDKFYLKTFQYDYINKFPIKTTKQLPRIKKINLNFGCKSNDARQLATILLALQLITNQKGQLTNTKKPNVLLKLRKGSPVGCKTTLRKTKQSDFLYLTLVEIFPKMKNFDGLKTLSKAETKSFTYEIIEALSFEKLEENYHLFNNLPKLNITITTTSTNIKELEFILKSLKIPFQKVL